MPRFTLSLFLSFFTGSVAACGAGVHERDRGPAADAQARPRLLSVTPPLGVTCGADAAGDLACYSLGLYEYPTELSAAGGGLATATRVLSTSGRNAHSCAALEDGGVFCWSGAATTAPVVDGQWLDSLRVTGVPEAISVSAGQNHTCAVTREGSAHCWGSNESQQTGAEALTEQLVPDEVAGLDRVVSVSAGGSHTCALLVDRAVACWGDNSRHQLGASGFERSASPIVSDREATALDAGLSTTCIVRPEGSVACWGADLESQAYTVDDTDVEGVARAVDVAVGRNHACALHDDGTVSCWGAGSLAQLGNGPGSSRPSAQPVSGISGVVAIGAGGDVTCALLATGAHWCWGGYSPQPVIPQGS